MSVCYACLGSSAQRQYLVLRDVCHFEVLFHFRCKSRSEALYVLNQLHLSIACTTREPGKGQ